MTIIEVAYWNSYGFRIVSYHYSPFDAYVRRCEIARAADFAMWA